MPPLSTPQSDPLDRLRAVPWNALAGHSGELVPALRAVLGGAVASDALWRLLRSRPYTPVERTALAEALFGVALWRLRLAYQLGLGAPGAEHARALLFSLLRDLGGVPEALARSVTGETGAWPSVPAPADGELVSAWSVPPWLAEHLKAELGDAAADFCRSLDVPGPICARANLLKGSRDAVRARLEREGVSSEPTAFAPEGLRLHGRPNIYGLPSHQAGLFEIQDEGSQLLGVLLDARPGESVLDLCAGNGGKTVQLAARMQNQGSLWVHDVDMERLDRLMTRCSRAGVNIARVLPALPAELTCDRVLIDAPCSSLGALRRGPDVRFRIGPGVLSEHLENQARLLETGARCVRSRGRLVYATCTVNRAENEAQVLAFLANHPEFTLVRPGGLAVDSSFWRESWFFALPHLHDTDAFFAAVLERR